MAFQTNVLRDGQWVTETVDLQAALRASAAEKAAAIPGPEPPVCGVLTKTIVESPITRWILPVRLRSKSHKDVAFIGVSCTLPSLIVISHDPMLALPSSSLLLLGL